MKLELKYTKKEDIPAGFEALYTEVGDAWVFTAISGLKTQEDITKIKGGLDKERNDHKETKAKLAKYTAIGEPDDVLSKLDRIEELEAAAGDKIDDDKLNKMVETRVKAKLAPLERQVTTLTTERDDALGKVTIFEKQNTTRTVHDQIRSASTKAKLLPTAVADAINMSNLFELDDSGNAVTKDNVGVTPGVSPEVWLTEVKETRPHWWGDTKGVGATGGDGGGGGVNPFSHEHWNITEQGRMYNANAEKAEQMAKAAGTTVGGRKPAAKK